MLLNAKRIIHSNDSMSTMGEEEPAKNGVVSLNRASSSLELLSQTAAWKHDSDNEKSEAGVVEDDEDTIKESEHGDDQQQRASSPPRITPGLASVSAASLISEVPSKVKTQPRIQTLTEADRLTPTLTPGSSSSEYNHAKASKTFLPAPVTFGGSATGNGCQYGLIGEHEDGERSLVESKSKPESPNYGPGLYLSHSHGSAGHETETPTTTTTTTRTRTSLTHVAPANKEAALSPAHNSRGASASGNPPPQQNYVVTNYDRSHSSSPFQQKSLVRGGSNSSNVSSSAFAPPRPSLNQRHVGGAVGSTDPWAPNLNLASSSSNSSLGALVNHQRPHGSNVHGGSMGHPQPPQMLHWPDPMASNHAGGPIPHHHHLHPHPSYPSTGPHRSYPSDNDLTLAAAAAAGRENWALRQQLVAQEQTIISLQEKLHELEQENLQLRQLPTGKISQIPIEDMLDLMHEFGSEVSDTAMPPRKSCVQKASVVRQFRRWNPNFLQYFEHVNGKWVPKLGREGELARREQSRREAAKQKKNKPKGKKDEDY